MASVSAQANPSDPTTPITPVTPEGAGPAKSEPIVLNIPSLPLGRALNEFARQSGLQVMLYTKVGDGLTSQQVVGSYTPDAALSLMLGDADLRVQWMDGHTIAIRPKGATTSDASSAPSAELSGGDLKLARVAPQADAQTARPAAASDDDNKDLQEIVVSAQKRTERLQDVPVPVTAIEGQALVERNQLRLRDYYTTIPGLMMTNPVDERGAILSIRGLSTGGFSNPALGATLDELPLSSAVTNGGGVFTPEIDPGELARLEVLRGPQGTLYGANSMGGLIKYVSIDPSTERLAGSVGAGASSARYGNDLGYNARASVNVPLGETWAARISGFTRRDPGYIDNVVNGKEDQNTRDVEGGRVALLWQPSENFSAKLSAILQNTGGNAFADVLPGSDDPQQSHPPGVGLYDLDYRIYSATLSAKAGRVELTSASRYATTDYLGFSENPANAALSQRFFGVSGYKLRNLQRDRKFSQELRATAPLGERFELLGGAFYTDESAANVQTGFAVDPTLGTQVGELGTFNFPATYSEWALFANLTVRLTERFDVQLGARESRGRQTFQQTNSGIRFGGTLVGPEVRSKDDAFTYLVTPRFRITPQAMVYARFASGYRPGGPNTTVNPAVPGQFVPDTTENYEVGLKADFLERRFSIDASAYYIDWKDVQLTYFNGFSFFANGGGARSQGLELTVESRPVRGLTLSGWVALNDATLTDDLGATSPIFGRDGDRLPFASRVTGHLAVQQDFSLTEQATGFVGAAVNYVSDSKNIFTATAAIPRLDLPSYATTDLTAGARFSSFTVTLFANNIFDKRAVIGGGPGTTFPLSEIILPPRTVGIGVRHDW